MRDFDYYERRLAEEIARADKLERELAERNSELELLKRARDNREKQMGEYAGEILTLREAVKYLAETLQFYGDCAIDGLMEPPRQNEFMPLGQRAREMLTQHAVLIAGLK